VSWGLIQVGLALWWASLLLTSTAIAVLYPAIRPSLAAVVPAQRAFGLRVLGVAPLVVATLFTVACFAPKLVGSFVPHLDHCAAHDDHHIHLCPNHPPEVVFGSWSWWVIALAVLAAATMAGRYAWRVFGSWRTTRTLLRVAARDERRGVWVVPAPEPFAWSLGLGDRRTIVSTALQDCLDDRALDVVLEHEAAHRDRRDGWWRVVVGLASWTHLPAVARRLHADLELAGEQACDERAARRAGDPLEVAGVILRVARLRAGCSAPGPALLAVDAGPVDARVHALLREDPYVRCGRRLLLVVAGGLALSATLLADPLHHAVETVLHVLVG